MVPLPRCAWEEKQAATVSAPKPKPNPAKPGPNPAKPGQRKAKELTLFSLSGSSLFKHLRRPLGPKNSSWPPSRISSSSAWDSAARAGPPSGLGRPWRRRRCSFLPRWSSVLWSSFPPLDASEGLAPLASRTVGRPRVRLDGRAASGRRTEETRVHATTVRGTQGKRQGDSIRRPAGMRPLKKARSGFEPLHKADGRQPFMPHEYLTNPCL